MSSWSRDAVVAALATVPGIEAHPVTPAPPAPGQGWPRWVFSRLSGGKLSNPLVATYDALVTLPPGLTAETVDAADALIPQLVDALARIGLVDTIEPVLITVQNGAALPAVRVRITPRPERTRTHANH